MCVTPRTVWTPTNKYAIISAMVWQPCKHHTTSQENWEHPNPGTSKYFLIINHIHTNSHRTQVSSQTIVLYAWCMVWSSHTLHHFRMICISKTKHFKTYAVQYFWLCLILNHMTHSLCITFISQCICTCKCVCKYTRHITKNLFHVKWVSLYIFSLQ
jgi:hypothetical protein